MQKPKAAGEKKPKTTKPKVSPIFSTHERQTVHKAPEQVLNLVPRMHPDIPGSDASGGCTLCASKISTQHLFCSCSALSADAAGHQMGLSTCGV